MINDDVLTPQLETLKTQNNNSSDDHSSDQDPQYETVSEGKKKKFICIFPDCQKVFRFKSEIERHISVHSEAKPFACTFDNCKKSFKRLDALENHTRSQHTGEAVLACHYPGCGLHFTTSSKLRYHTILHGGERPYKCSIPGCDRSFVTLSQMKQHERSAIAHKKLGSTEGEGKTEDSLMLKMDEQSESAQQVCALETENAMRKSYDQVRMQENIEVEPVRKVVKVENQQPVQEQISLRDEKEILLKRVFVENEALKDRLVSTKKLITDMKVKLDQIGMFGGDGVGPYTVNHQQRQGFALQKPDAFIPSFTWMDGVDWNLFGNTGAESMYFSEDRSTNFEPMEKKGDEEDLFTNFGFEEAPFLPFK